MANSILLRIALEGAAEIKKQLDDISAYAAKFGQAVSKGVNEAIQTKPAVGKAFGAEEGLEKSREAAERFREVLHTLHPILGAAGLELGNLGAFARVAGAGMGALGVAVVGSVLVGLAKIAEQADRTGARLAALSGSGNTFADLSKQAKELGISIGDLAPISEASLKYTRQLRADQEQTGGISHPPGFAGFPEGSEGASASNVQIFRGSQAFPGGIPSDKNLDTFNKALIEGSRIDHTPKDDAIAGIRALQESTFKSGQVASQDIKTLQNVSPSLAQEVAKALSGSSANGGLGRNFANPEELTAYLDKGGGKLNTPQLISAVTKAEPGIHERAETVKPGITESLDHLEAAAKHAAEALSGDGGLAGVIEKFAKYVDNFIGDHSKEKPPQSLGEVFTSDKGDLLGRLVGYLRGKNIPDLVANGPQALRKSPSEVFPDLQKNENKLLRGDFSNAYTPEPKSSGAAENSAKALQSLVPAVDDLGKAAKDAATELRGIKSPNERVAEGFDQLQPKSAGPTAAAAPPGTAPAAQKNPAGSSFGPDQSDILRQPDKPNPLSPTSAAAPSAAPTSGRIVPKFNEDGSVNPYGGQVNNRPIPDDGYTHPFAEAPHNEAERRQQTHESATISKKEADLQKIFNKNIRDQNGGNNPSPDKDNYAPPTHGHYDPRTQNFVANPRQPARDPNEVPGAPKPTTFPTYQRELTKEYQGKYGPSGNPPGVENPFTAPPTVQPAPGNLPGDGPLIRVPIYPSDADKRSEVDNADTALGAAGGGHIRGPGTTTSDSIPAMLSDKEYVLNAKAVERVGVDKLDAVNSGAAHFADGGQVKPGPAPSPDILGNLSITYDPITHGAYINGVLHVPGDPILNDPRVKKGIAESKAGAKNTPPEKQKDPFVGDYGEGRETGDTGNTPGFAEGGLVGNGHFAEGGSVGSPTRSGVTDVTPDASPSAAILRHVVSRFADGGMVRDRAAHHLAEGDSVGSSPSTETRFREVISRFANGGRVWPSPGSSWRPAASHEGAGVEHFAQGGSVGNSSAVANFRDQISRYTDGGMISIPPLDLGLPNLHSSTIADDSSVFKSAPGGNSASVPHHTVDLRTDHGTFRMMSPEETVKQLNRAAIDAKTFRTGKAPGWAGSNS
jgi:hypothetical protein